MDETTSTRDEGTRGNSLNSTQTPWRLVRQTPPRPDLGLEGTLAGIRDVPQDELARISLLEGSFERFGPRWGYAKAEFAAHLVADSMQNLRDGASRTGGQINEADTNHLGATLRNFALAATGYANDLTLDTSQSQENSSARYVSHCHYLLTAEQVAFTMTQSPPRGEISVSFSPPGVLDSALQDVEILHFVTRTMTELMAHADRELLNARDELIVAGQALMGYLAEVAYGYPVLVENFGTRSETGQHNWTTRSIRLDLIAPTLTACDAARARIPRQFPDHVPSENTADHTHKSAIPENGEDNPSGVVSDQLQSSSVDHDETTMTADRSETIDAELLLREVAGVSMELEARWSRALADSLPDDFSSLRGRLESLIAEVYREVNRQGRHVVDQGFTEALPQLPLTIESANALLVHPTGQNLISQNAIAKVRAIEMLIQCLRELNEPHPHIVDAELGVVTWWDQAQFQRVRDLCRFAARAYGMTETDTEDRWHADVQRALIARDSGLSEAVSLYLLRAITNKLDAHPGTGPAFEVLRIAVAEMSAGSYVPLSTLLPISDFWLHQLSALQPMRQPADSDDEHGDGDV